MAHSRSHSDVAASAKPNNNRLERWNAETLHQAECTQEFRRLLCRDRCKERRAGRKRGRREEVRHDDRSNADLDAGKMLSVAPAVHRGIIQVDAGVLVPRSHRHSDPATKVDGMVGPGLFVQEIGMPLAVPQKIWGW